MKEYYKLLGLTETATDEEIRARYNELKEKYREERWQDGEAGNEASRMLTKIETAYTEILSARKEQAKKNAPASYEEISAMIKEGKINEAQARLDDCNDRPAEWHYLQAVIFYKKKWKKEHISKMVLCFISWIVLIIALKFQNVEIYVIVTIAGMLAMLFYIVLYNQMMIYVENNAYKKIEK